MQVKKQQLELYMEQQAGSELWKEYIEAVYCHPVYLSYMHAKCWAGWTQAGIKISGRNINNLRYADSTTCWGPAPLIQVIWRGDGLGDLFKC